jgi:hypothetical protein
MNLLLVATALSLSVASDGPLSLRVTTRLNVNSPILDKEGVEADLSRCCRRASKKLMGRFWEIDQQTKKRLDVLLRLYEVSEAVSLVCYTGGERGEKQKALNTVI